MKLLLVLILLIPTLALSQTYVEFTWQQPDSTMGVPPDLPPQATKDGSITKYEIFKATPTDTLYYGEVPAPFAVADSVLASVEFEMDVPTSITVRAVDLQGRAGPMSEWSTAFTVEPGPPGEATKPEPIRVHFGG
ncbi:MAG: hypothetical protein ACTSUU_06810 [Candidatus Thorarchaeota archaeon]